MRPDLLSVRTSPVRESIGSSCVGLLWVISGHAERHQRRPLSANSGHSALSRPIMLKIGNGPRRRTRQPTRQEASRPHKSAHRLHASVVVPTYVDIPSDLGLTPQHNSLAHNIKLYAERLPMLRLTETAVGLLRHDLNC